MKWFLSTGITLVFAMVICIIFGLYPARKAAKLNAVEALRYEEAPSKIYMVEGLFCM